MNTASIASASTSASTQSQDTGARQRLPVLSIVVVTYQSAQTLQALWDSLAPELITLENGELFLVDNASSDASPSLLRSIAAGAQPDVGLGTRWPVEVIANRQNVGFARACNQALARANGRYLLLLNPDTTLEPGAIGTAIHFLEAHPDVGILGARVRLPNGRLDAPCRRSFKTPSIYFYKLSGLSRLFPRSRRFGRYYLSYLDEAHTADVDAVIGAFLLIRRETVDQIGLMDERFFMYCEDEDWCFRAKAAGWRVVYYPEAVVWHRKGASTRQRKARMILEWHRSIYLFHRKNLAARFPPWLNGLMYAGMAASLLLALANWLPALLSTQATSIKNRRLAQAGMVP